jgi:L-rhamnose mutarotase
MQRIASVIGVSADGAEEYERLHADVWPAVLARLQASNVTNFSIYRYQHMLFSYMEYVGNDLEADMAAIAADPTTLEWWELCGPLQRPMPDRARGEWWKEIREVFHLD